MTRLRTDGRTARGACSHSMNPPTTQEVPQRRCECEPVESRVMLAAEFSVAPIELPGAAVDMSQDGRHVVGFASTPAGRTTMFTWTADKGARTFKGYRGGALDPSFVNNAG